jgi:hypothetical protein
LRPPGPASPDYAYYKEVKIRQGGNRATVAVAGKLARRVRHTWRASATPRWPPIEDLPMTAVA